MRKFLLLFLSYFLLVAVCLAQNQEQITITTYYPSPYGVYQGLEARRLVIGVGAPANPMPQEDGVVNFQELPADPAFAQEGMLYYNGNFHNYYYYNGTRWIPLGGCLRFRFTDTSGITRCPAGTAVSVTAATVSANGTILCCPFSSGS